MIDLLPNAKTTHLRVVNYDLWTGSRTQASQHIKTKVEKDSKRFSQTYHEVTRTDKVNIARHLLQEALVEGNKVKIEGLGIFYTTTSYSDMEMAEACTMSNIKRVSMRLMTDNALRLVNEATATSTRNASNNVSFYIKSEKTTEGGRTRKPFRIANLFELSIPHFFNPLTKIIYEENP